jgi:hypothetical protein
VEDDGTAFSKVESFISLLKSKYNTLRMRTSILGADIQYTQGKRGLLAKVQFHVNEALS